MKRKTRVCAPPIPSPSTDKDPERRASARARRHVAQVAAIAAGIRSGTMPEIGPPPAHVPTRDDRRADALTRLAIAPHLDTSGAHAKITASASARGVLAAAADTAHRLLVDRPDDTAALRDALESMIACADESARTSSELHVAIFALTQQRDALVEVTALTSKVRRRSAKHERGIRRGEASDADYRSMMPTKSGLARAEFFDGFKKRAVQEGHEQCGLRISGGMRGYVKVRRGAEVKKVYMAAAWDRYKREHAAKPQPITSPPAIVSF